jgi:ABC-2 type transport system ATP-binding protein
LFVVTCGDLARARAILLDSPGVIHVNVFGDGLHVLFEREEFAAGAEKQLEGAAIARPALRKITPSMEDAFIDLVGREARERTRKETDESRQ